MCKILQDKRARKKDFLEELEPDEDVLGDKVETVDTARFHTLLLQDVRSASDV